MHAFKNRVLNLNYTEQLTFWQVLPLKLIGCIVLSLCIRLNVSSWLCACAVLFLSMSTCVYVRGYTHLYISVGGQRSTMAIILRHRPPFLFFEERFLPGLSWTEKAGVTSRMPQLFPCLYLCSPGIPIVSHHVLAFIFILIFLVGSKYWTQALILARQALYWLIHFPT